MFENHRGVDLPKHRTIVATTAANVRDGVAGVGVSADDSEIGREGAALLAEDALFGGTPLGRVNVVTPKVRYWVNCTKVSEYGIHLSADGISGAYGRFACGGK
jgi:hypothetical protein